MFVSINRLQVKPGCESQIESRFGEPDGLENVPGFTDFQLLRHSWAPHPQGEVTAIEYLATTRWESKEDFINWTRSDAFKKAHSGPRLDIWAGPAVPSGYDVAVERLATAGGEASR